MAPNNSTTKGTITATANFAVWNWPGPGGGPLEEGLLCALEGLLDGLDEGAAVVWVVEYEPMFSPAADVIEVVKLPND